MSVLKSTLQLPMINFYCLNIMRACVCKIGIYVYFYIFIYLKEKIKREVKLINLLIYTYIATKVMENCGKCIVKHLSNFSKNNKLQISYLDCFFSIVDLKLKIPQIFLAESI